MKRGTSPAWAGLVFFLGLALGAPAIAQGDAKRGEYLAKVAGCKGCHTEAKEGAEPFAGGRALQTPFGTFHGPNITPHPQAGIGRWSEAGFRRSLRRGERADGAHYYPAFPYLSFTRITDADARDLWAYFRSLPPSARASRPHDLWFPSGWRFVMAGWKWLYFTPAPFQSDPARSPQVDRGAYLVNALGHCGECHTPRNWLGAPRGDRYLAGADLGDGAGAPNLTPAGLKKWSDAELVDFLKFGLTPDGDVAGETMGEVIRNSTSQLAPEDLAAMISYLRSLAPVAGESR